MGIEASRRNPWRVAATLRALRTTVLTTAAVALAFCLLDAGPDLSLSTPQSAGVYAMANFSFFAAISGVLIASSDFGGQLTTSVLAVPNRGSILAAKLVLAAVVTTVQGVVFAALIATIYQSYLGDQSVYATGTAGTLLLNLALAVCSWTALGIISTCVAFITRSQTVALVVMIGLAFGGTPLMMMVPVLQYLPSSAGVLMFIDRENQTADWLNPPDITVSAAGITVVLWCAASITAAALVLTRTDIGARQASLE